MWRNLTPLFYLLVSWAIVLRAEECIQGDTCVLPECFCGWQSLVPGGLKTEEIPQMVLFSFDDAVNVLNYKYYNQLFNATRKNPNGCPISMTLFVSHNYTDYTMVRSLHNRGMEIASHSLTHRTPAEFWKEISREDMWIEALESKQAISRLAGIPEEEIYGFRFPYHQPGGDVSFEVLKETGYEYDASLLTGGVTGRTPQQWPLTLDYGYKHQCITPPCPTDSHKGLWEVPVVPIMDLHDIYPCTYIDGCFYQPENQADAVKILEQNFKANYDHQRAPFYINMHAWWFQTDYKLAAMDEFIESLTKKDDVYIINFHQMLEWVRQPTNLTSIGTFEPWGCE